MNKNINSPPIFDNGKSFFCGNKKYDARKPVKENLHNVHLRPFTASNAQLLKVFPVNVEFNWAGISELLQSLDTHPLHQEVLLTQLNPYIEKELAVYEVLKNQYKQEVLHNSNIIPQLIETNHTIQTLKGIQNKTFGKNMKTKSKILYSR